MASEIAEVLVLSPHIERGSRMKRQKVGMLLTFVFSDEMAVTGYANSCSVRYL